MVIEHSDAVGARLTSCRLGPWLTQNLEPRVRGPWLASADPAWLVGPGIHLVTSLIYDDFLWLDIYPGLCERISIRN